VALKTISPASLTPVANVVPPCGGHEEFGGAAGCEVEGAAESEFAGVEEDFAHDEAVGVDAARDARGVGPAAFTKPSYVRGPCARLTGAGARGAGGKAVGAEAGEGRVTGRLAGGHAQRAGETKAARHIGGRGPVRARGDLAGIVERDQEQREAG
jgi:hypothetical protein